MRFVALISGGKDSIYSILEAVKNGHTFIGCVHLGAPTVSENDVEEQQEEESYMYQTAASSTIKTLVKECLLVDCIIYRRKGKSINTSLMYETSTDNNEDDEVEDLFNALQQAKNQFHNVEAVCSGAILSTYQRVRIEYVCNRLDLISLSYLWRRLPQYELLQQMINNGIHAVLVKTACPPGLIPSKHLNKSVKELWDIGLFQRLHEQYQFHVCGEGGEYETLALDSPIHKKKLVLDEIQIIENDTDGVGELQILKCHAEDKTDNDIPILWNTNLHNDTTATTLSTNQQTTTNVDLSDSMQNNVDTEPSLHSLSYSPHVTLPHVHQGKGGLLYFSEIISSMAAPIIENNTKTEAELAVEEAREIFTILNNALHLYGATPQDVMFVHLYLSEMSHFNTINTNYQDFFGSLLPPSRSCVAVGNGVLPGQRRVLFDCMVQIGSGEYMRTSSNNNTNMVTTNEYAKAGHNTKGSKLREVLHVQSISYWAPVCVGPYSQVNTLRSGIHLLAGQIGLIPSTMTLHSTWTRQLEQCWKNIASVLDALDGASLSKNLFSSLIYVSSQVYHEDNVLNLLESISANQINTNGTIIPGRIDALQHSDDLYGGYEDEGTWEEMKQQQQQQQQQESSLTPCPALVVLIPEMPKGASVEVEVIVTTTNASKSLDVSNNRHSRPCAIQDANSISSLGWDTGHNFNTCKAINEGFTVDSFVRVIGHGCGAAGFAVASHSAATQKKYGIEIDSMLNDMMVSIETNLAETRSGLSVSSVVNVRLFHVAWEHRNGKSMAQNDGVQLRTALRSVVSSRFCNNCPATTVVPVQAIHTNGFKLNKNAENNKVIQFAMQVLLIDPIHLETEIWIHKDRDYAT